MSTWTIYLHVFCADFSVHADVRLRNEDGGRLALLSAEFFGEEAFGGLFVCVCSSFCRRIGTMLGWRKKAHDSRVNVSYVWVYRLLSSEDVISGWSRIPNKCTLSRRFIA